MTAHALQADLQGLPGIALSVVSGDGTQRPSWRTLDAAVHAADAVWLLGPVGSGVLERLARQVIRSNRILLGSRPPALRVTASKRRSAHLLARCGIAVTPVYTPGQHVPDRSGPWLVRADDSAGWSDTHLFASNAQALAWAAANGSARASPAAPYVLQPFIGGKPGSLSLLCCDGMARLLACNEQRLALRGQQFHLLGTTVNHFSDADGAFDHLAQAVAAAIPGLWGHVTVEFIRSGMDIVVFDVSASLGTAYVGLHTSLGRNPAAMALDLLHGAATRVWTGPGLPVRVDVGMLDAM